jgi:hypothetical protein
LAKDLLAAGAVGYDEPSKVIEARMGHCVAVNRDALHIFEQLVIETRCKNRQ